MFRLLSCATAALTLAATPLALADEFDWLYFPMYTGDSAHAVHLKSLKFRSDGLLTGGARMPRWNDDWTGPESAAGWYNYSERLIDCETGYWVPLAHSLLDQAGKPLASRAETRAKQIENLTRQISETSEWPEKSDIFLACAAASNTAFQKERAAAAAKVQPLYANRSLVEILSADTQKLYQVAETGFNFDSFASKQSAPAASLFAAMRAHAISQRRAFNAAYQPAAANPARDAALASAINEQMRQGGVRKVAVTRIAGDVIEFSYVGEDQEDFFRAPGEPGQDQLETGAADCALGLSLPVTRQKRKAGKAGPALAIKVKEVLQYAVQAQQSGDLDELPAGICRLMTKARAGGDASAAAPDLNALPTPEAMLLALRAARRSTP